MSADEAILSWVPVWALGWLGWGRGWGWVFVPRPMAHQAPTAHSASRLVLLSVP